MTTKVKVRSGLTLITVRIGTPVMMSFVRSLNCLQKSIAFTPFCPKAGPMGGDGVACPAGMINFKTDAANGFFDIYEIHEPAPNLTAFSTAVGVSQSQTLAFDEYRLLHLESMISSKDWRWRLLPSSFDEIREIAINYSIGCLYLTTTAVSTRILCCLMSHSTVIS